jgi:hypothetical protein
MMPAAQVTKLKERILQLEFEAAMEVDSQAEKESERQQRLNTETSMQQQVTDLTQKLDASNKELLLANMTVTFL